MNQNEINEREWNNPANWGGAMGFYSSRADSRLVVPKPNASMGWTLNMAKPAAWMLILLLVVVVLAPLALILLAVKR